MINHEHIKTWDDFKALELDEQVKIINELMAEGHTIPQISDSIGTFRTTIGSHFRKNGYKRIGNEYKAVEGEKQAHTDAPKKKDQEPKEKPQQKVKQLDKNKALEVYADVHNIIVNIDTDDYVRTSISLAKSTNAKLDAFLKGLKLLNKQDVITVALEEFIAKYSK